uniref:T-cell-interacting, activating receptor on myeloid cells protein 1 n=1 Tax=Arvicanthis niloticus TaxID=61156 RepID=UPI001487521C|nr:T-cell-interacting, activating receptor on myeloid cells protein 1 [Arvicanthis niloticus]
MLAKQTQRETGTAEFRLTNLRQADAGYYTCEYYLKESPDKISSSSDSLLLLVTGYLYKPSLRVCHSGLITTGEKVNLQCQKPYNLTDYKMFALLKEGTSSPIQFQDSESDIVDFTLQNVTLNDTGRRLKIAKNGQLPTGKVAGMKSDLVGLFVSPSAVSKCYTKCTIIRLGMSAMFVVFMAVFLAEAWNNQRVSLSRPR